MMILFDQVSKRYPGGYNALSEISFSIQSGEMVVLSGHSGAGKSTLLSMLPAIEQPTAGRVCIHGQDVSKIAKSAIPYLRRRIGLVLQESRLLFDRSLFDNVALPLMITGIAYKEACKRVEVALERVGLTGRSKEFPAGLSGGEQQRLAIARAVVNRPMMLIADEPTAHLDSGYAHDIVELFVSFNKAGVTVIISTHDERLFEDRVSRRLILSQGMLVGNLT